MKDDNHSFSINVCQILNGHCQKAILLKEIFGWCKLNAKKGINIKHGIAWTYNSASELAKKFPYMPSSSIGRWLKDLEKEKWIYSGSFNKKGYDRTKWYTIDSLRYKKASNLIDTSITQNEEWINQIEKSISQIEESINQIGESFAQIEQPIPTLTNSYSSLTEEESKEAPSFISKLESDLEKAKAEILELKIEKEKQRKKVALKKESSESYEGLSNFEIMDKRKENRTWTQLDTNFNGGFKMPKEWSDNLKNEVLGHWIYMDEKKGKSWGTTRTLSAQKELITEWQKGFTEIEIINALLDCQQRGNVTPNPLWTKNRKIKEDEQKKQSQPIDDGLTFTERAMQQKFGSSMPNNQYEEGNSVIDTEWYEQ